MDCFNIDDASYPTLWPIEVFVVIDRAFSSTWVIASPWKGEMICAFKEWAKDKYFFERLVNDEKRQYRFIKEIVVGYLTAVVMTKHVCYLEDNAGALEVHWSEKEMKRLNEAFPVGAVSFYDVVRRPWNVYHNTSIQHHQPRSVDSA